MAHGRVWGPRVGGTIGPSHRSSDSPVGDADRTDATPDMLRVMWINAVLGPKVREAEPCR
jgi:hypothetical protein